MTSVHDNASTGHYNGRQMLARLGLVPHQERFYDLFNRSVANTLDGARVLADLLERFVDVPFAVARLKDIERRGDSITR